MPIRVPADLPIRPASGPSARSLAGHKHGEMLAGKVTRIDPEGMATIKFPAFEARAPAGGLLQAGRQVFAYVQKVRGDTLLALVPGLQEGEIVAGESAGGIQSENLARFGEFELRVVPPATETGAPPPGAAVRAQVQVMTGKVVLQVLPEGSSAGPIVAATVMAERADGTIVLDVGGTILIAEAAEGFEEGERVQAAMRRVGDKMFLRILQKNPAPPADAPKETASPEKMDRLLQEILGAPQYARLVGAPVSGRLAIDGVGRELALLLQQLLSGAETGKTDWAAALASALRAVSLNPEEKGLAGQVAAALRDSGVFLESRLLHAALSGEADSSLSGDLKLALLQASQRLADAPGPAAAKSGESQTDLAAATAKVNQVLDTVKAEQLQNLRLLPTNELYVQLPFAEDARLGRVEIRISRRGERARRKIDPRNVLLTLAVTTSKLGRVKSSLSIVDGRVSCRFKAESERVVSLLEKNTDALKGALEKLGYRVTSIECAPSGDEQDLSVFGEPTDEPTGTDPKGIDLRA